MEIVRLFVFPLVLLLGAGALVRMEAAALAAERRAGHPRWIRFGRRVAGAACIAAIAAMLHFGPVSLPPGASREVIERISYYWITVMLLALLAMVLALWDVSEGLRHHAESVAQEEITRLREQLRATPPD